MNYYTCLPVVYQLFTCLYSVVFLSPSTSPVPGLYPKSTPPPDGGKQAAGHGSHPPAIWAQSHETCLGRMVCVMPLQRTTPVLVVLLGQAELPASQMSLANTALGFRSRSRFLSFAACLALLAAMFYVLRTKDVPECRGC